MGNVTHWGKCHAGENVTMGKMSQWGKCHNGENVTLGKMSVGALSVWEMT